MGLPLEPLTAHDIGQAAGEKDHRYDQKKDIEHVKPLPLTMVFDTAVYSRIHYSAPQVKRSSKEGPAVSRFHQDVGDEDKVGCLARAGYLVVQSGSVNPTASERS
jgi:hypothetical protein